MKQPKPIPRKYVELVDNIDKGIYQIPKFQRDFVWEKDKIARLLDSILKGYPIGAFILWKTKDRLRAVKKIGGKILFQQQDGDFVYYVLDGQQRIASLYLALKGVEGYRDFYVDLSKSLDSDEEICTLENAEHRITFYELLNEKIIQLSKKYGEGLAEKIENLRDAIKNYEFSTIGIEDLPIEQIADVFTRINTGGKVLTLFEIVNAKVYDEPRHFDLEEKFNQFIEELKYSQYETIAENKSVILQTISGIIRKNTKRSAILTIKKNDFIDNWNVTVKSVKFAIDKIRSFFRIPVSKLLPYYTLIVPIAYFFYKNDFQDPTLEQMEQIQKYFFRSALSFRFSSGVEAKLNNDFKIMESIIRNEEVDFAREIPLPFSLNIEDLTQMLIQTNFTTSSSFCTAILDIYAYFEPKRFNDNSQVRLDNSWLHISTSKNFHHFFPKAYLRKIGKSQFENSIINITFVDDYLNKRIIRDNPPSKYILEFARTNPHIAETLKTHLIDDLEAFGILTDEFDQFLAQRAERVAQEILKRI